MKSFFKPLSKRDAQVVAILFGLALIYLVVAFVKTLLSGAAFDDVRSDIIIILFVGIIEFGMIKIGFSKDAKKEEEPDADSRDIEAAEAALEKDQAEFLAEKYDDDPEHKYSK